MTFAISVVVSMLDPLALVGYILAGILIRSYWAAVGVAVAYRFILQLAFVPPGAPSMIFASSLVGAALATSLAYLVARAVRRPEAAPK